MAQEAMEMAAMSITTQTNVFSRNASMRLPSRRARTALVPWHNGQGDE